MTLRDRIRRALAWRLTTKWFRAFEARGFHVTRNDYYSPIPDTRELPDELWTRRSALCGIDMREVDQLALLQGFSKNYRSEYESFPRDRSATPHEYFVQNHSFGPVDGETLYCMVRHLRPSRVIEIGSGFSTFVTAAALRQNGDGAELVAVEPYPNEVLRAGFPGLTKLVVSKVQEVPLDEFDRLRANDILFIDSSHVLRTGSDVHYEILEILPRLRPGVVVHFHDIFFPGEYPKEWVLDAHRFWNEQYVLQAFLTFNHAYEVLFAAAYLHLTKPGALEDAFSSYSRNVVRPGSLWARRV